MSPLVKVLDEYLPAFELSICEHTDADECLICLHEIEHDTKLNNVVTKEGHA